MDIITAMYVVFGITMGCTMLIVLGVIAGKDILLAFRRRFSRKGCDVYIANPTRIISHYFKVPKDGIFRINKIPYITNPEKTINLTLFERNKVVDYLLKREKRLRDRITDFTKKKAHLEGLYKNSEHEKQRLFIMSQIAHYEKLISDLEDTIRLKEENYFKDKKPTFFYIEGDPIPKDFYEYYSSLDSKMVDNLVSRAISQPPSKKTETDVDLLKKLVFVAVGAAILAAYFAFRNNAAILEICKNVGASCGL